jgi:hypothetical protein
MQGKMIGVGFQFVILGAEEGSPRSQENSHGRSLFLNAGEPDGAPRHPFIVMEMPAPQIRKRCMGPEDLFGAPPGGSRRPLFPDAGRSDPGPEKGQLKPISVGGSRFHVPRIIPPLGAMIRVGAMVSGKVEIA